MAKNCPECGEELPFSVTFCRSCGARVVPVHPKEKASSGSNPYSSPAPIKKDIKRSGAPYRLATAGQRIGNLLIDNIATYVLSNIAGFILGYSVALSYASNGWAITQADIDSLRLWGMLLGVLVIIFYYVIAESLGHRTIGKMVTGTKVINVSGRPPSFGQVLGRTAARFIPFEVFSFLGAEAVGWHDTLSGTRVVKTR